MKQSKVIGIILVVLNIALAVVCIILSAGQDKTKPVFDFQAAEVVYRTGMDEEKLKEGITARDNVDGDITDRIVVEKIVTDPAENTAVVFFAVSDRAGNVAKCSKVFPASLEGENEELADQLTQAGYDAAFASESSLTAESTDAAADQENETDNSENAERGTARGCGAFRKSVYCGLAKTDQNTGEYTEAGAGTGGSGRAEAHGSTKNK